MPDILSKKESWNRWYPFFLVFANPKPRSISVKIEHVEETGEVEERAEEVEEGGKKGLFCKLDI